MDFDIFGRNIIDKVGNQKTLYYVTSNNLYFCTIPGETGKHENRIFHSNGLRYTHNTSERKISSVMCLIASNSC